MQEEERGIRINKFLSEAGVCSRRAADREIAAGNVRIGERTANMGDRVQPQDTVFFFDEPVEKEKEKILLAVNKPVGVVCTAEKREKNNIIDFLHYPKRIYPVGRLDKDSEGLLLMTNDGEIVNKIMRAGNWHEKEYLVTVDRAVTAAFVQGMANGVPLAELGATTRKCKVEKIGRQRFRIVLTQGWNRQIRRMCEYFGYRVLQLQRVRIMNIRLGSLKSGAYRNITAEEWETLNKMLRDSSSEPIVYEKQKRGKKNGHKSKD